MCSSDLGLCLGLIFCRTQIKLDVGFAFVALLLWLVCLGQIGRVIVWIRLTLMRRKKLRAWRGISLGRGDARGTAHDQNLGSGGAHFNSGRLVAPVSPLSTEVKLLKTMVHRLIWT